MNIMIIDITGIELIPGDNGKNCPGNGKQVDALGLAIECCCDECDYFLCCSETHSDEECRDCLDKNCPNSGQ